jgi:hypothetical protein
MIKQYDLEADRQNKLADLIDTRKKILSAMVRTHQKGEYFDLSIDLDVINDKIKELGSD